jgi:tryptophan synthase alpha chain
MGVTGARASLDPSFVEVLERINRIKNRPVLMGFGIKTPEHAAAAANLTEGVIVGSALIDVMDAEVEQKNKIDAACRYMGVLREALSQPKATS